MVVKYTNMSSLLPDLIQPEFRPILHGARKNLLAYFGDRLQVIYLCGSIACGEALVGASDVDWWMFLSDEPDAEDIAWCNSLKETILQQYYELNNFHLTPVLLPAWSKRIFGGLPYAGMPCVFMVEMS